MSFTKEADAEMMELAGLVEDQANSGKIQKLAIRFSMEPQQNEAKSLEAGRPVFDDVETIEIRIPGDPDIRKRAVRPEDKREYPKAYLAFKSNHEQSASGTPLSIWPQLKGSQVEEAKYFGIQTVEQLSEISDANLQKLGPGWLDLRKMAKDYLAAAKDGALLGKMRKELEERDSRIASLEKMLSEQGKKMDEFMKRK